MERGFFSDIGILFSSGVSLEGTFFIGVQAMDRGGLGSAENEISDLQKDRV